MYLNKHKIDRGVEADLYKREMADLQDAKKFLSLYDVAKLKELPAQAVVPIDGPWPRNIKFTDWSQYLHCQDMLLTC